MFIRKVALISFFFVGGCSTSYYNPNITDPVALERQKTIDEAYCTQVSVGSIPMPEVRHYQSGVQNYQINSTVRTYNTDGSSQTSYVNGYASSYPNPGDAFSAGLANGASMGAALAAGQQRRQVMDGCMYTLGWTNDPVSVPKAVPVDYRKVSHKETPSEECEKQMKSFADTERKRLQEIKNVGETLQAEAIKLTKSAEYDQLSCTDILYKALENVKAAQSTSKEEAEFFEYTKTKALTGDANSQYLTGFMLITGDGVNKNYSEGVSFLNKAADQGNTKSLELLSEIYAYGNGVEKNNARAADYIKRAAGLGSASAYATIGDHYMRGTAGFPQDKGKALENFRKSMTINENPVACIGLAVLYAMGERVSPDNIKAYALLERAELMGDPRASDMKNLLKPKMSDSDIVQAKRLALEKVTVF